MIPEVGKSKQQYYASHRIILTVIFEFMKWEVVRVCLLSLA